MPNPLQAPSPDWSVQSEMREDHLRVTITGMRSTLEASIAVWREVGRLVQAQGVRRVLVVSRLNGPLPTPDDQQKVMNALVGFGFEGVRTAFVLQDAVNVAVLEHGEIYARELGQESRVFGSEAIAEVWLRHGS